jgi:hypothetical protein
MDQGKLLGYVEQVLWSSNNSQYWVFMQFQVYEVAVGHWWQGS